MVKIRDYADYFEKVIITFLMMQMEVRGLKRKYCRMFFKLDLLRK